LHSQYVFFLLLFVVKNRDLCATNQEIHVANTRCNTYLHLSLANMIAFQKGSYFFWNKVI